MTSTGLVKVGGACAVLAVGLYIVAAIVYFAGVGQVDSDDVAQFLLAVNDNRAAYLTSTWLALLGAALLIPTALGFFQALREAAAVLWIAVAAMCTGALLFMATAIVQLGVGYELAPGYVEASDATKPEAVPSLWRRCARLGVGHVCILCGSRGKAGRGLRRKKGQRVQAW